jgi:hypothetical protein
MTRLSVSACGSLLGLAALALTVPACGGDSASSQSVAQDQFGELRLALTGKPITALSMNVRIFTGPVLSPGKVPTHEFACKPYGPESNTLVVRDLEARNDYAVVVELFKDDKCKALAYRAYRGAIAVKAGSTSPGNPYWLPLLQMGAFNPMAQVNADLAKQAADKPCTIDEDCRAIHPNATCSVGNRCTLDNLFPLNGWQRRALTTTVALDDGRVALIGGMGVLTGNGFWEATTKFLELFDPAIGILTRTEVANWGGSVGMADAVTLTGQSFAFVGGTARAKVQLAGGKLTTALDVENCPSGGDACAISEELARWTMIPKPTAQQVSLGVPRAFPTVTRVQTKEGERLLVCGGIEVPIPAGGDKRVAKTQLCRADSSGIDCPAQTASTMAAARANNAVACVERDSSGGCLKVVLIGGNKSGPRSEVYDATTNTFAAATDSGQVPNGEVHGGKLYAVGPSTFLLVGASSKRLFLEDGALSSGGDMGPYKITVNASVVPAIVSWAPADLGSGAQPDAGRRLMAASTQLADGSVLLIGGLDQALKPLADALWIAPTGALVRRVETQTARFGGSASRIGGKGPLAGCVVLAGGFSVAASGAVEPQNQVEIFCPGG